MLGCSTTTRSRIGTRSRCARRVGVSVEGKHWPQARNEGQRSIRFGGRTEDSMPLIRIATLVVGFARRIAAVASNFA